jgi:hypothetical protein
MNYGSCCEVSAHMPCPFSNHVEFENWLECAGDSAPEAIYPSSTSWNAIVCHYTKGTVERAVFEITIDEGLHIDCSVAFRSSNRVTRKLYYTHHTAEVEEEMEAILEEQHPRIFSQAFQTIRDHPLLANVKHLYIRRGSLVTGNLELVGRPFGSMYPLGNLILYSCDLR